jgi:hypothetical protein
MNGYPYRVFLMWGRKKLFHAKLEDPPATAGEHTSNLQGDKREKKKNAASFVDVKLNYEFLEVLTGSIR